MISHRSSWSIPSRLWLSYSWPPHVISSSRFYQRNPLRRHCFSIDGCFDAHRSSHHPNHPPVSPHWHPTQQPRHHHVFSTISITYHCRWWRRLRIVCNSGRRSRGWYRRRIIRCSNIRIIRCNNRIIIGGWRSCCTTRGEKLDGSRNDLCRCRIIRVSIYCCMNILWYALTSFCLQ